MIYVNKMIKFYMSCPIFSNWPKSLLSRLDYYFKKINYNMGAAVYRKGEICSHIYLVLEGEFE